MGRVLSTMLVLAMAAGACNKANKAENQDANAGSAATPVGTSGEADKGSSTTVTGCLQQGDGRNDFILAPVNAKQRAPVATGGTSDTTAVQQKQHEAAEHTYKLSGDDDALRRLLGHQVRVTGTIDDRGDVQSKDSDRELKERDLAKIKVASVESISNTCGTAGAKMKRSHERPRH